MNATKAAREVFEAFGISESQQLDRRQFVQGYLHIAFFSTLISNYLLGANEVQNCAKYSHSHKYYRSYYNRTLLSSLEKHIYHYNQH